MEQSKTFDVGIVNGKEWLSECDKLPGNLRYRVRLWNYKSMILLK